MRYYSENPVEDFNRWDADMEQSRMRRRRGKCMVCVEDIDEGEPHYDIEGDLIHIDCLEAWAEEYKR